MVLTAKETYEHKFKVLRELRKNHCPRVTIQYHCFHRSNLVALSSCWKQFLDNKSKRTKIVYLLIRGSIISWFLHFLTKSLVVSLKNFQQKNKQWSKVKWLLTYSHAELYNHQPVLIGKNLTTQKYGNLLLATVHT